MQVVVLSSLPWSVEDSDKKSSPKIFTLGQKKKIYVSGVVDIKKLIRERPVAF